MYNINLFSSRWDCFQVTVL